MNTEPSTAVKCLQATQCADSVKHSKPRKPRIRTQSIDVLRIPDALVREPIVIEASGLSGSTIYREVLAGRFPKPRRIGNSKVWVSGELTAWLKAQADGSEWQPAQVATA